MGPCRWITCALLASLSAPALADNYAVIVAGSFGYSNYRHQADACHAYQVLVGRGVPKSHIVTLLYDDLPTIYGNPFPGQLFNKPTLNGTAGRDVRAGVAVDYRHKDVTTATLLAVLTGNRTAVSGLNGTGRVLESGPQDNVFVNFVDHGAAGLVEMPVGPPLKKRQLLAALKHMSTKGMFRKLVFYMEACNSGSMFADLPADMGVYAATAANPNEPSWGAYCPPFDFVNGRDFTTCLGDLFSVNWMEDAERQAAAAAGGETLEQQFRNVRNATNRSHVMQYGELSTGAELVSNFLGGSPVAASAALAPPATTESGAIVSAEQSAVDVRNIPLVLKFYKYLRATGESAARRSALAHELLAEVRHHERADAVFGALRASLRDTPVALQAAGASEDAARAGGDACFDELLDLARERCVKLPRWTDYTLKYSSLVSRLCERHGVGVVRDAIANTCGLWE